MLQPADLNINNALQEIMASSKIIGCLEIGYERKQCLGAERRCCEGKYDWAIGPGFILADVEKPEHAKQRCVTILSFNRFLQRLPRLF